MAVKATESCLLKRDFLGLINPLVLAFRTICEKDLGNGVFIYRKYIFYELWAVYLLHMSYLKLFRMPTPMKITGRSSSITNAFINSILPIIQPTEEEVREALSILGMTKDHFECAYCGASVTEWDHLRPIVVNKQPTGFISEIHNLVPSCGKCNQSKGNKDWHNWMLSDATLSPKSKKVLNLQDRISRLEAYESWGKITKLDFQAIVGKENWERHWQNLEGVQELMREAQKLATEIFNEVARAQKV